MQVDLCDTGDHEQIEAAIAQGCRLVYLETPTNPTLKVMDIARLSAAAHEAGAIVVADNTFATPINQNPLALGADLVLHSATKFLGGHADALGGALCGTPELIAKVYHYREITGASLDPMAAYLLIRGMKTLALRIGQQNESALRIARGCRSSRRSPRSTTPASRHMRTTPSPSRQMRGYGGVLSFMLGGGFEAVKRVLPRLQARPPRGQPRRRGDASPARRRPRATSSAAAEEREAMGIPEGLIRYSVGIEDAGDLIARPRAGARRSPDHSGHERIFLSFTADRAVYDERCRIFLEIRERMRLFRRIDKGTP